MADQFQLKRFASLTLDPKKLANPECSDRYIRQCWRKMRVLLERRFGNTVRFIAVLEFQQSGMAHLHVLLGVYIPQEWLSQAWQSIGGGEVVDIRYVDVHRVSGYLATYLTGEKIEHTLDLLRRRGRIFTTARGITLNEKSKSSGWWVVRHDISLLHSWCEKPLGERYKNQADDSPLLIWFEGGLSHLSADGIDAFTILRKILEAAGKGNSRPGDGAGT